MEELRSKLTDMDTLHLLNRGTSMFIYEQDIDGEMYGKGSDPHKASVVGDTVGDPFKDTSSVALNPVIKFTTLFGLLAMEI